MFNISIILEDLKFRADSPDGLSWMCSVHDLPTNESKTFTLTGEQVSASIALMTHPEGTSLDAVEAYKILEPIYANWPRHLRPIP